MLKINHLAVRPERVEGRMAKYDTVSVGRGEGEGPHVKEINSFVLIRPNHFYSSYSFSFAIFGLKSSLDSLRLFVENLKPVN